MREIGEAEWDRPRQLRRQGNSICFHAFEDEVDDGEEILPVVMIAQLSGDATHKGKISRIEARPGCRKRAGKASSAHPLRPDELCIGRVLASRDEDVVQ